ncbi:MAG TPA: cation transporter [Ramlibacter sp.]|nr:cation transporter [Ramlibacter sp.]
MKPLAPVEFPPEVEQTWRRARRLEWITLGYLASAACLLYVTMGTSQAMRTSFYEDVISLVPAAAFLVGTSIARRRADPTWPYGTHRATSIAHLVAAIALCGMGLFLLAEAAMKVFTGEKPTIGGMTIMGTVVWAGWPMLGALLYSSVPSFILGRMKLRLAPKLHDKVLHADAGMMRADWMAESATAVGVIGTGFGLWWLDPAAAALVSLSILRDGLANLRTAVTDLADRRPRRADDTEWEPWPERLREMLLKLDWVQAAEVRMREAGHIFLADVLVVPRPGTPDLVARIAEAAESARQLNWRVHEVTIMPVERIPD